MGRKPFSAKQKREQLRAKRAAALEPPSASSAVAGPSRRGKSTQTRGGNTGAPKKHPEGRGRFSLQLEEDGEDREALRALAHVPVMNGVDADLCVMDVRKVRPAGYARVPRRPEWSYDDNVKVVDRRERAALERWMKHVESDCYFERNLETWRQLWRVIERSDVLVLVIDVRYPALHFVPDLYQLVKETPGKEMVVAMNKCDLVSNGVREAWKSYFEKEFPDLAIAMFSSFPDARLAPCDANAVLLSKRERRMARAKLAAWGADLLADAIAELPLPAEKQKFLADWRDAVRTVHLREENSYTEECTLSKDDFRDENSRIAALRSFSPVSDDVTVPKDPPETNKERARAKKAQRRKRRRGKPDVTAAVSAAARAKSELTDTLPSPTPDSASVVSLEDDWMQDAPREDMITIGMVGHPNTGKSSMINGIFRKKVVSTSRTPGHTKHLQTMFLTKNVRLCDCPGLVFPARASRELQTLAGMFPIAQLREPYAVVKYLADRLTLPKILGVDDPSERAKLRMEKGIEGEAKDEQWTAWTICEAWALKRGFRTAKAARLDVFRAANSILRLALEGRIVLGTVPPGFIEGEYEDHQDSMLHADWRRLTLNRTSSQESGEEKEDDSDSSSGSEEGGESSALPARANGFFLLDTSDCNTAIRDEEAEIATARSAQVAHPQHALVGAANLAWRTHTPYLSPLPFRATDWTPNRPKVTRTNLVTAALESPAPFKPPQHPLDLLFAAGDVLMSQHPRRDRTRISSSIPVTTPHQRFHTVDSGPRKRPARKRDAAEAMLNSAAAAARASARTRAASTDHTDNSAAPDVVDVSTPRRSLLHMYRPAGMGGSGAIQDASDARNRVAVAELNAAALRFKNLMYGEAGEEFDSSGGFKRLRSSADSDAGSSSCKDMDEPEVFAPDSTQALIDQLRKLIYYVESKPALSHGSASFMRDYLRTMLLQHSVMTEEVIAAAAKTHKADVDAGRRAPAQLFKAIPEELAKHIFSFLGGPHLARAREVCRKWNEYASEEHLWKALVLKKWRALETDEHLWRLISRNISRDGPNRWRLIYPEVIRSPQWRVRLQKTGKFICNLIAHQISGTDLDDNGLPDVLIVERRFNILHLQTFVIPDAAVLYFEPEQESDRAGFNDFIEYLTRRTRAGLALQDQRRFIFIPPCDYTRSHIEYNGQSLLGVVQNAYPPLAP